MNFGENIQQWFSVQIGALFMVVIGSVSIYYLIKREFSRFVGFGVFALIVATYVFAPKMVKELGINLFRTIFGG